MQADSISWKLQGTSETSFSAVLAPALAITIRSSIAQAQSVRNAFVCDKRTENISAALEAGQVSRNKRGSRGRRRISGRGDPRSLRETSEGASRNPVRGTLGPIGRNRPRNNRRPRRREPPISRPLSRDRIDRSGKKVKPGFFARCVFAGGRDRGN